MTLTNYRSPKKSRKKKRDRVELEYFSLQPNLLDTNRNKKRGEYVKFIDVGYRTLLCEVHSSNIP